MTTVFQKKIKCKSINVVNYCIINHISSLLFAHQDDAILLWECDACIIFIVSSICLISNKSMSDCRRCLTMCLARPIVMSLAQSSMDSRPSIAADTCRSQQEVHGRAPCLIDNGRKEDP